MIIVRIIAFILIVLGVLFFSPWLMLPFVIAYAFVWRAYELLLLSACIDAYFGAASMIPYYTLAAGCIIILLESIKPHLSFYAR